jgi:hypothetical protein
VVADIRTSLIGLIAYLAVFKPLAVSVLKSLMSGPSAYPMNAVVNVNVGEYTETVVMQAVSSACCFHTFTIKSLGQCTSEPSTQPQSIVCLRIQY